MKDLNPCLTLFVTCPPYCLERFSGLPRVFAGSEVIGDFHLERFGGRINYQQMLFGCDRVAIGVCRGEHYFVGTNR